MKDRAYEIATNYNYDGHQKTASLVYKFFAKKTGWGISVNEQLDNKLHKSLIEKNQKNIWDLKTIFGQHI